MSHENKSMLDTRQFLSFSLGGVTYALNLEAVQEIERELELTRLPEAPPHVDGVADWRGKPIPLLNLWYRLGLSMPQDDKMRPVVVLRVNDEFFGFAVEDMPLLCSFPQEKIMPPPDTMAARGYEMVTGMGQLQDGRLVLLLDEKALHQAASSATG